MKTNMVKVIEKIIPATTGSTKPASILGISAAIATVDLSSYVPNGATVIAVIPYNATTSGGGAKRGFVELANTSATTLFVWGEPSTTYNVRADILYY